MDMVSIQDRINELDRDKFYPVIAKALKHQDPFPSQGEMNSRYELLYHFHNNEGKDMKLFCHGHETSQGEDGYVTLFYSIYLK